MTCCVKVFPQEQKIVDIVFQTFYNYYFHILNIIGLGMGRGECHIIKKNIFNNHNYGIVKWILSGEYYLSFLA